MNLSFEGDAIAIYGTTGAEMGNYVVTLDGQSQTFNGGSDGSFRTPHDMVSAALVTEQHSSDCLLQTILVSKCRGISWTQISYIFL